MIHIDKIFLKFEGRDVGDKAIPLSYLGNLLRSFQAYFRKIVLIKYPGIKKNWTELVLTNIEAGSSITTIDLKQPILLQEKTFKESTKILLKLFNTIQLEDEDLALKELKKNITNVGDRIGIYRSLKSIWSKKKITTSIGSSDSYSTAEYIKLDFKKKKRIHKWLKKEFYKGMISIKGFLTRIKTDDPSFFTIKDEYGESINVYFELEDLNQYKDLLTKPVKIKGIIELIGNQRTIKTIKNIEEFNTITIQTLPTYKLTKPLTFNIEYFEDGLLLSEDFIPLNLDLETLSDLECELQDYLEYLVESYVEEDINKLTPKAKELREKIIKLLNLEGINEF